MGGRSAIPSHTVMHAIPDIELRDQAIKTISLMYVFLGEVGCGTAEGCKFLNSQSLGGISMKDVTSTNRWTYSSRGTGLANFARGSVRTSTESMYCGLSVPPS